VPSTIVKLGTVFLGGSDAYSWELRAGTDPVTRLWNVSVDRAKQIVPLLGKPQTLSIEGPGQALVFEFVYPLEILPGKTP